jgi:hypothetical protein
LKLLRVVLALVAALVCTGTTAHAWDETGHQQIADIAWTRLNDKAKKEIAAILMAGDTQTRPASDSEADVRAAFRKSAVFPDFIKFTKTTIYEEMLESMNKTFFTVTPPDPKDNEDVRCKTWHYFDIPIRDKGVHAPKDSNALNAFAKARYELSTMQGAAAKDRKMQCWWLAWIAHLTGDLHQPLHCVSNHETLPEGDAGGNLFMIKIKGSDRPGRLHGYWDGGITRSIAEDKQQGQPATMEDISTRWSKDFAPSAADAANLDVMSWIRSGASLADTIVYVGIEKDQEPSKGYEQTQAALCRRQAVLGGARLAAILNEILGK